MIDVALHVLHRLTIGALRSILLAIGFNLVPHLRTIAVDLLYKLELEGLLGIIAVTVLELPQSVRRESGSQEVCEALWNREIKVDFAKAHEAVVCTHRSNVMGEGQKEATSIGVPIYHSHCWHWEGE